MVAIVCKFVDGELEKKESNEQQDAAGLNLTLQGHEPKKKTEDEKAEKDIEITD